MRENTKMDINKEKGKLFLKIKIFMRGNFFKIKCMGMVNFYF